VSTISYVSVSWRRTVSSSQRADRL